MDTVEIGILLYRLFTDKAHWNEYSLILISPHVACPIETIMYAEMVRHSHERIRVWYHLGKPSHGEAFHRDVSCERGFPRMVFKQFA